MFKLKSLIVLIWLISSLATAKEASTPSLAVGSTFEASDTLACDDDANADAKDCLTTIGWKPSKFTVRLEAAEPGCGDFLVRFPSAKPIGNEQNDLVAMEWFAPHDDDNKIRTARAMVVIHESGDRMTVGRVIARGLSGQGLHAFLVNLPGYGPRRVPEVAKSENILAAMQQGIADARRARDAVAVLPMVDHSLIGIQGTSLGGFVTATVAGLDHGYDRVFILLAGGNIEDVIMNGTKDAAKARQKLAAAGISEVRVKQLAHGIEPLRLAHRIRPEDTWLYSGKYDEVVPPRCSKALAVAAHLPDGHHIEMPCNHYSGAVYLPQVVEQMRQRMSEPQHATAATNTPQSAAAD